MAHFPVAVLFFFLRFQDEKKKALAFQTPHQLLKLIQHSWGAK